MKMNVSQQVYDKLMEKYTINTKRRTETTLSHIYILDHIDFRKIFDIDEEMNWKITYKNGSYHRGEDEYLIIRAFSNDEEVFSKHYSVPYHYSGRLDFEKIATTYLKGLGYEPENAILIYKKETIEVHWTVKTFEYG